MKVVYCKNYKTLSKLSSESIIISLNENPRQFICAATGNSPIGLYKNLAEASIIDTKLFERLSILKLDEWGGIELDHPSSCESFIMERILQPLSITDNHYISFKSNPISPNKECKRIQTEINNRNSIDICILGLGRNGHLGFNEPASFLQSNCHVAKLSKDSMLHQMIYQVKSKPTYGLTVGMGSILQSKKIVLLITGLNKKSIIKKFLTERITTQLPASFLWLHPNVECYIDLKSM